MSKFQIKKGAGGIFILTNEAHKEYIMLSNTDSVVIEYYNRFSALKDIWSGVYEIEDLVSIYKLDNLEYYNYAAVFNNSMRLGNSKEITLYVNLEMAQALIYFYKFKLKCYKIEDCPTDGLEKELI